MESERVRGRKKERRRRWRGRGGCEKKNGEKRDGGLRKREGGRGEE